MLLACWKKVCSEVTGDDSWGEAGEESTFSDLAGLASFAAVALSSNPLIEIPVILALCAGDYQTDPCQRLKGPH
jgi:hypothetical protein